MNILTLEHISETLGGRPCLHDVTVGMEQGERIGVLGVNGTGKSTLLSIVGGKLIPDEGQVVTRSNLRISYLAQNPTFDEELSILENVCQGISGKEEHWNVTGEAKAMLERFGIEDSQVSPKILSGGQKKRAALSAALLTPCDLLILDEPTNHLDHEMIEYLQNFLMEFKGPLLMVTHDRYFLDEVCSCIWEIDKQKLYRYEGSFETYLQKKQERMDFALAAERKMAALYKQDLAWMMRGARARSTKQKAHIQRFEALRDRDKIVEERNVAISALSSRMGNKTVEVSGLGKAYGDKVLFSGFTYTFLKNDRIGIIGPNGCGKTTLLKILVGEEAPTAGTVELGQTVKIGYFSQENEALREDMRVIDYVKDIAEYIRTPEGLVSASSMCERFLFDDSLQYAPIEKLSGGEKRRLYLLRILMAAPNVLILDEPTNDLDIQTLQILEDYLDHFAGIVVTVSHDRYFLDRVVNRIFAFEDGELIQSEGGYEEYRQRKLGQAEAVIEKESTAVVPPKGKPKSEKKRLSYAQQREYDSLEGEIDALTAKSEELEAAMEEASSSYAKLSELTAEYEKVQELLEQKMERFFELEDLVKSFEEGGK
ncbi:MAG: ABC-F family ATP-binding cassette domain-containing protein [Blautia sp.]|nr:ABC-F family ATP-binding cassette domain-containing protein [Blautia sp.]